MLLQERKDRRLCGHTTSTAAALPGPAEISGRRDAGLPARDFHVVSSVNLRFTGHLLRFLRTARTATSRHQPLAARHLKRVLTTMKEASACTAGQRRKQIERGINIYTAILSIVFTTTTGHTANDSDRNYKQTPLRVRLSGLSKSTKIHTRTENEKKRGESTPGIA